MAARSNPDADVPLGPEENPDADYDARLDQLSQGAGSSQNSTRSGRASQSSSPPVLSQSSDPTPKMPASTQDFLGHRHRAIEHLAAELPFGVLVEWEVSRWF